MLIVMAHGVTAQTPRALQPLDGNENSAVYAINKRGEAAGSSDSTPVVWDIEGAPTPLPLLDGHSSGEARAINKRGEVAGTIFGQNTETAVVWNSRRTPNALQPAEGTNNCRANGINDGRWVAGYCRDDDDALTAVRWNRKGTPQVLPLAEGATRCFGYAINNHRKVAGACRSADGVLTAVVWGVGTEAKPRALLPPEGLERVNSEAFAINNRSKAAGYIWGETADGTTIRRAVVWDARGVPEMLQMPPAFDEDEDGAEATAINNRGEIAGRILRGIRDISSAVVWDRKGTPVELPGLDDIPESSVWAINDRGQVAAITELFYFTAVVWDDWR
jgi:uncharacterized membrane protein